ncbi:hypothetical protein WK26_08665 [Burkholderia vietnamiensis]|nr:hypothetical protein WK26_08665 [Burkholderia vietnamiensis]KVS42113.1 hypothetical protein WK35_25540 [Burkholderia vietnamiensis]
MAHAREVIAAQQLLESERGHVIQRDAAPPGFPVRIVWGEDDGWIPLEQGQALADRIAHGKLIKVPRAAHLVQEDAPEAIVAAMFDR